MAQGLDSITPEQAALLAPLFALALAEGLDANEAAALGAFITVVGDTLALISAQSIVVSPAVNLAQSERREGCVWRKI